MHSTPAIHMSIMVSYPMVLLVTQPECRRSRGRHPAAEAGQLQEGM
ncbi:MAG: hypothetical protein M3Y73_00010 [Actinomycetota bacterium]|nr:hypothetical protein [Actinomycetota bacterium]